MPSNLRCRRAYYPCVSDEHYFATVVAFAGRGHETTCNSNVMHVSWKGQKEHPRTYYMEDVSLELLAHLRDGGGKCQAQESIRCVGLPSFS